MIFDQDCDLAEDTKDCTTCYRYDICNRYFSEHPEQIYCADDLKQLFS